MHWVYYMSGVWTDTMTCSTRLVSLPASHDWIICNLLSGCALPQVTPYCVKQSFFRLCLALRNSNTSSLWLCLEGRGWHYLGGHVILPSVWHHSWSTDWQMTIFSKNSPGWVGTVGTHKLIPEKENKHLKNKKQNKNSPENLQDTMDRGKDVAPGPAKSGHLM